MKQNLITFLCSFIFIFLMYEFWYVRNYIKYQKYKKKKKSKKNVVLRKPAEVMYLKNKYKIDLDKINYKNLLHIVSLVSSFDISLIIFIVCLSDNFFYRIICVVLLLVPIMLGSYHLIGLIYKRKDGKNE